jgi:hypothetical protein
VLPAGAGAGLSSAGTGTRKPAAQLLPISPDGRLSRVIIIPLGPKRGGACGTHAVTESPPDASGDGCTAQGSLQFSRVLKSNRNFNKAHQPYPTCGVPRKNSSSD